MINHNDLRILRHAALELQDSSNDLVRVAGIIQRIKNWWKARFNPEFAQRQEKMEAAYEIGKGPIAELGLQLKEFEKALKNQDPDTVAQLVGQVPGTIAEVNRVMNNLSKEMRAADALIPVTYTDQEGKEISGDNLRWTTKGYKKDKELVQKLFETLPEEFKEIPVGQRINRPITDFQWFSRYNPSQITISNNVYAATQQQFEEGLKRGGLEDNIASWITQYSYDDFIENLKNVILNQAILLQVNFPDISKKVSHRPTNQMIIDVQPGYVSVPFMNLGLSVHVNFARLNDLGAAVINRNEMSLVMVRTITLAPETRQKLKDAWRRNRGFGMQEGTSEDIDPEMSEPEIGFVNDKQADGPITKLIKRALLRERLPLTSAIVKINGSSFDHNARFAKILSSGLRQEIDAECSVRSRNDDVEVQVYVRGSEKTAVLAIYGISSHIADTFSKKTKTDIAVHVVPGISVFGLMQSNDLDLSLRKIAYQNMMENC